MTVTLVAKDDLVLHDVFDQPIYVGKYEIFHGTANEIGDDTYITLNLHGLKTVYLKSDLEKKFMIKECDVK